MIWFFGFLVLVLIAIMSTIAATSQSKKEEIQTKIQSKKDEDQRALELSAYIDYLRRESSIDKIAAMSENEIQLFIKKHAVSYTEKLADINKRHDGNIFWSGVAYRLVTGKKRDVEITELEDFIRLEGLDPERLKDIAP